MVVIPHRLDRRGLYELVWALPISHIAPHYGLSDVGFTKLCRRWGVPTPGRGYWAKKAAGKVSRRPALPRNCRNSERMVLERGGPVTDRLPEADGQPRKSILAHANLDQPHPLTKLAADELRSAKPRCDGLLRTNPATAPDLRVPTGQSDRFLRILDAMVRAWIERGGEVKLSDLGDQPSTCLCFGSECVGLRLDVFSGPTRGASASQVGRPTIWLRSLHNDATLRDRWSENKSTPLEKLVRSALDDAEQHLKAVKVAALDRQCRVRQRNNADARRRRDEQADAEAIRLRQQLHTLVDRWQEAEKIRSFLTAMRTKSKDQERSTDDRAALDRWFAWAESYADCVDPTQNGRPHDPGRAAVERLPVEELELTSRARGLLRSLEVKNSDELAALSGEKIKSACGHNNATELWREITDVLAGLGYDTSTRGDYLW